MTDALKNLFKHLDHKRHYPHAEIAFGSRVTGETTLGANVKIEQDCYVFGSTLGDNAEVRRGCHVFNAKLEKNVIIYPHTVLGNVQFGSFSYVNEHSLMRDVRVGRFSSIGPHFLCGYGEHPANLPSTSPVFYSTHNQCGTSFADRDYFEEMKETTIGHDVWIGARVFARDGVKIGDGAIVAAGAVITKDIPAYAIAGGVPAKIIRLRFDEKIVSELLEIKWWNWSEEKLRASQQRFVSDDINSFVEWARAN